MKNAAQNKQDNVKCVLTLRGIHIREFSAVDMSLQEPVEDTYLKGNMRLYFLIFEVIIYNI